MRKLLFCVALLLLTNPNVKGQEAVVPSPFSTVADANSEAVRLLSSQGNRERAWGAYLVGAHGLREHAPLLVSLLEDPNIAAGGWEEGVVRQAALDALIRLDAQVPAETLLALSGYAPDEAVILLARAPEMNQQALLSLFMDGSPVARWLAVGNLLAGARAPGFAARLLAELKIEASVYVYEREDLRGYGAGSNGGCGCGVETGPEGFPPVSFYELTTGDMRGAVLVAPGRRTVYYVRTPWRGCRGGPGGGRRDDMRVEYVAELLGTTEGELKLEASPFREVVCQDERQCRRSLAALRDEVVGGYADALKRLLDAGLLDQAEAAGLKPDITLRLNDWRDRRPFPLPSDLRGVKVEVFISEPEPEGDPAETPPDAPR
jgi:hypothetical protein